MLLTHVIAAAKSMREKVVVCSDKGTSRSCMIVCADLMEKNNWCVEKAYEHVKKRHSQCAINIVALKNLLKHEKMLNIPRTYAAAVYALLESLLGWHYTTIVSMV